MKSWEGRGVIHSGKRSEFSCVGAICQRITRNITYLEKRQWRDLRVEIGVRYVMKGIRTGSRLVLVV